MDSARCLAQSLVSSKLDYLNALLINLPDHLLQRLQRVQNTAARIVSRTKRCEHITPVLRSLHWLPVRARVTFKLCYLVFCALHGSSPAYISELLHIHELPRSLRSTSNGVLLRIPRSRATTYGDRAFSVAAPSIWNSLPLDIRQCDSVSVFRKQLKTHLFKMYL